MFCKQCGKQISDQARFCPYCGADQTAASAGGVQQGQGQMPQTPRSPQQVPQEPQQVPRNPQQVPQEPQRIPQTPQQMPQSMAPASAPADKSRIIAAVCVAAVVLIGAIAAVALFRNFSRPLIDFSSDIQLSGMDEIYSGSSIGEENIYIGTDEAYILDRIKVPYSEDEPTYKQELVEELTGSLSVAVSNNEKVSNGDKIKVTVESGLDAGRLKKIGSELDIRIKGLGKEKEIEVSGMREKYSEDSLKDDKDYLNGLIDKAEDKIQNKSFLKDFFDPAEDYSRADTFKFKSLYLLKSEEKGEDDRLFIVFKGEFMTFDDYDEVWNKEDQYNYIAVDVTPVFRGLTKGDYYFADPEGGYEEDNEDARYMMELVYHDDDLSDIEDFMESSFPDHKVKKIGYSR